MVVAQYYNLLNLGINGYKQIMQNSLENAQYLGKKIEEMPNYHLTNTNIKLPILAFTIDSSAGYSVYDLSDKLRERGWIVPAYSLPPNAQEVKVLRIVIKENFSRDMADMLLNDIKTFSKELKTKKINLKRPQKTNNNGQINKHIC